MILKRIGRIPRAESSDYLRGLEGDSARIYFRGMSHHIKNTGLSFAARTRRPPRDR